MAESETGQQRGEGPEKPFHIPVTVGDISIHLVRYDQVLSYNELFTYFSVALALASAFLGASLSGLLALTTSQPLNIQALIISGAVFVIFALIAGYFWRKQAVTFRQLTQYREPISLHRQ